LISGFLYINSIQYTLEFESDNALEMARNA